MRPEILFPLFAETASLPGVGARLADLIAKVAGTRVADLLFHLPAGLIDRRAVTGSLVPHAGHVVTARVRIGDIQTGRSPRAPVRVYAETEDGHPLILAYFHTRSARVAQMLPPGEVRIVSGRLDLYDGVPQMVHPDHVVSPAQADEIEAFEPVYPMTAGLGPRVLRKAIRAALKRAPDLPEWQDAAWLTRHAWPHWRDAIRAAHTPKTAADIDPAAPARRRLAYDELLANQVALAFVRRTIRGARGRSLAGDGRLSEKVLAALPFGLTGDQQAAIGEIRADMASGSRMLRLLQGDVGAGKTLVAFLALLTAIEAGTQGAFMAPTEILARQHAERLQPLADAAGIRLGILTGRDKAKERAETLARLAAGEIDLIVGTHALFQDEVAFRDLGLVVVDEQHRFGVEQRLKLSSKGGGGTNVLLMTATPIPRTLSLTHYGDMDVTVIREKPAGRKPIATRAVPLDRLEDVVAAVRRATANGARVYWVCPLVEESETLDVAAAQERFAHLDRLFPGRVGLVHGRLAGAEKDRVMGAFARGDLSILVATTVIEVGVDVPEATIMVIEHAERFGLAQLHQLRGRVGRGGEASTCLLLYHPPLTEGGRARLNILRETEDGFRIAEEDLRLRGAGEVLGTRQSGDPEFRLASLDLHADLIQAARDDARLILERDPELKTDRGRAVRVLLYLFERDAAIRYLRSG
ncbi:ATP-dependent DNA helicase RecG [Futiania mangrovi]|uniref:ATP-dependent DNA helicase RecG n=1 Tax=Futiania mangrovi TaxID=2959716 RepID=A0A9J6PDD4_9PROT|nr:ATP-dependent DNA helicase RecG [Futiania mangrovii]MCP1335707.1 ATP-dependent DNA helicase RecG [Futiania mangrovii]